MHLETRRFGELELPDEAAIHFDQGLYGFEDHRNYALVGAGDGLGRIQWLQSLEDPDLALLIMDPTLIEPAYLPPVDPADLLDLGLSSLAEGVVMVVCVLDADPAKITANLQAPLVFNPAMKKGRQLIVLDPSFPVKHPVFQNSQGPASAR